MTSFWLKIIALISMLLDHLGYVLNDGKFSFLNYLGRLAFPIFAFQISEGYVHTKNLKNYFSRLILFALISEIPFVLFFYANFGKINYIPLNIFFTLSLGLLCIFLYDKCKNKMLSIIGVSAICFLGNLLHVDYGYWGVLLIFIFYVFKDNKVLMTFAFLVMCIVRYYDYTFVNFNLSALISCIATFSAIIPILLYNGKLGYKIKNVLYIFYPLHLFLLYLLK